jgi:hypothetical protein
MMPSPHEAIAPVEPVVGVLVVAVAVVTAPVLVVSEPEVVAAVVVDAELVLVAVPAPDGWKQPITHSASWTHRGRTAERTGRMRSDDLRAPAPAWQGQPGTGRLVGAARARSSRHGEAHASAESQRIRGMFAP